MNRFTYEEMTASDKARELGIDNTPPAWARQNIVALVQNVLDPLREAWGKPLTVTSGYRCPELNKIVGGAKTSHHLRGMAADISTGNRVENRRLFQMVLDLKLPFTQLIDEKNFAWVHISLDPADVKRQVLRL